MKSNVARTCLAVFATLALFTSVAQLRAGSTPATGATSDELITQGGGEAQSGTGDFVAASNASALDEVYRYYIEVPSGQTELQIEIFDADILDGASDQSQDRDRMRGSDADTTARYSLFDPDGTLMATRYASGDADGPSDPSTSTADNVWFLFFDDDTGGITGGDTYADNFGSASYSNNDGSQNFAAAWVESNDLGGAGAGTGDVQIVSGELELSNDNDVSPFNNEPSLERELDISGDAAANVTFDWRTNSGLDEDDAIVFEVSDDGGTTYHVIEKFTGITGVASGSRSYDITEFIASDTRVRFRITDFYAGVNESFFVDDFQVRSNTTANGPDPGNGHWELVVDLADSSTDGDDVNAFGIRAHDGTSGSGGQEYNVYTESFFIVGVNDNGGDRDYTVYPYLTAGCDAEVNDFDWDADETDPPGPNAPPFGSLELTTRTGSSAHHTNSTMSDNDSWNSESFSSWTDSDTSDDYGVWTMDVNIEDYGAGNYGPVYLLAHDGDGGEPPPDEQPEPNSFRIYFPRDAGDEPIKPHVAQFLTFFDPSPGPNPPGAGQTSRYAVTVQVTNPTGSIGSITFSSTNTVTSTVPSDAQVTYQGVGIIEQGSIVSQPALGGSGDVVWNPGTVTAGSTAILSYFVDVTPTASPYSIDVTGTPGTDGTTATYVDETGDTTNSRATFEFGELCELTLDSGVATPVLVSHFGAVAENGGVVVEWHTAAEAATIGFDLYRVDGERPTRVNSRRLTGLLDRPQGGVYRFFDAGARPRGRHTYLLVEHDAHGGERTYGPFTVAVGDSTSAVPLASGYERQAHQGRRAASTLPIGLAGKARPPEASQLTRRRPVRSATGALRIGVREDGLYAVTAAQVASALGLSFDEALKAIHEYRLDLTLRGESVAWHAPAGGDTLEFYGQAPNGNIYTGEAIYRLSTGFGQRMGERRGPHPPAGGDGPSFRDTARGEQNLRPLVLIDLDPASDIWFWDFLLPGSPTNGTVDFAVELPDVDAGAGGATAQLAIHAQGAALGHHAVDVAVNGNPVGSFAVVDQERTTATIDLAQALLVDGMNSIELTATGGGLVFVDAFEVSYERLYHAIGDALTARGDGNVWIEATGFGDAAVRAFDLSLPASPVLQHGIGIAADGGGGFRAVFRALGSETPYLAVADGGVRAPASLSTDVPSDLRSTAHAVDYLVIAPEVLLAGAVDLAAHRAGHSGLATLVVDLADVYDEFAGGHAEATAIRDFLAYTHAEWTRAPRYVVLVGAGTYDYRDHLGLGGNLVPPAMVSRGDSLFATDVPYGDVVGDDGVLEIAVGRIPALGAAELDAFVAKLAAYEAAEPDWASRVTIAVDGPDPAADFAGDAAALSGLPPVGFDIGVLELDAFGDLASARQALLDDVAAGTGLLHYVGHGGVDRMAAAGWLTSGDVPLAGSPPLVTAVTCHIALHAVPGFDALGEHLVLQPGGGAIAVWAPGWLSEHSRARTVGDRLFRQLFARPEPVLGDALLETVAAAAGVGVPKSVLDGFQLLGDPATELRLIAEPPPAGCEDGCGGGEG